MAGGQKIQIDVIWLLLTVVAFLLFTYIPIYASEQPELADKAFLGLSLLVGGTVMGFVLCGFRSDNFYSLEDFARSVGLIFVGLMAVYVVNIYSASVTLAGVPVSNTLFMMIIGIAEEALFRGFLLTFVSRMLGSSLLGVGVSSVVGVAYHSLVYGFNDTNLLIVFGSFAVLGMTYIFSGYRLSVPMVAHALVNYLASV